MWKSLYSDGYDVSFLVWGSSSLCNFHSKIYTSVPDDFMGVSINLEFEFPCIFNCIIKDELVKST